MEILRQAVKVAPTPFSLELRGRRDGKVVKKVVFGMYLQVHYSNSYNVYRLSSECILNLG